MHASTTTIDANKHCRTASAENAQQQQLLTRNGPTTTAVGGCGGGPNPISHRRVFLCCQYQYQLLYLSAEMYPDRVFVFIASTQLPHTEQAGMVRRRAPISIGLLMALALLLLGTTTTTTTTTTHAFLHPQPPPPHLHQQHHQPSSRSPTALQNSFWQGLQELFNPGSSLGGSSGGGGAQAAEEEARRRRHFRVYEPLEKGGVEAVAPYPLGSVAGSLPSMDDLWREAWPTDACSDIMQRREDINKYVCDDSRAGC
jgi:hypothetical protein